MDSCNEVIQFAVDASMWTVLALVMFIYAEVKQHGFLVF